MPIVRDRADQWVRHSIEQQGDTKCDANMKGFHADNSGKVEKQESAEDNIFCCRCYFSKSPGNFQNNGNIGPALIYDERQSCIKGR
jgi:hypothetical protein